MKLGKVNVFVNGINLTVPSNTTLLQACEASGYIIPRFCYHDRLNIAGNCRMCLVEVVGVPKPIPSCAVSVTPNVSIVTDSPLVRKARESVLEFLLLNHPLDCPICDQGGECDLQDQALIFGSDRSRQFFSKRSVVDKFWGPKIKTIMTRCIHCTRCVRFACEVVGLNSLGTASRGSSTEITTYSSITLVSSLSGNLIDLCPVGYLNKKK